MLTVLTFFQVTVYSTSLAIEPYGTLLKMMAVTLIFGNRMGIVSKKAFWRSHPQTLLVGLLCGKALSWSLAWRTCEGDKKGADSDWGANPGHSLVPWLWEVF